jgi:hypothetical protein
VIVCSYFPNRWRDLSSYKLLILRSYRQFAGYAWCDYDKAFRQHAAATRLLDWSELVQLFDFHTAGSAYRGPSRLTTASNSSRSEPTGNRNHDCSVKCFSWNKGRVRSTFGMQFVATNMRVRCVPLHIVRSSAHQSLLLQIRQFILAQIDPLGLTKSVGYNYA